MDLVFVFVLLLQKILPEWRCWFWGRIQTILVAFGKPIKAGFEDRAIILNYEYKTSYEVQDWRKLCLSLSKRTCSYSQSNKKFDDSRSMRVLRPTMITWWSRYDRFSPTSGINLCVYFGKVSLLRTRCRWGAQANELLECIKFPMKARVKFPSFSRTSRFSFCWIHELH